MQEFSEVEWEWVYTILDADGAKRGFTAQWYVNSDDILAEIRRLHPGATNITRRKRLTSAWLSDEEVVNE